MRPFYAVLLLALGLGYSAHAQQPFERFGLKIKVSTLSGGRYPEFFANDSLRRIGSVVYNTRLRRIAYLLPGDSLVGRAKPEVTSRWFSPDPLAAKLMSISPYVYVSDNPVNKSDPDGREEKDVILGGNKKQEALAQLQAAVKGQLNLSMNTSGKVSYTTVAGATPSKGAGQLKSAIDNHNVTVNVNATDAKVINGNLNIGSFMGTRVTQQPNGAPAKVDTYQQINPTVLGAIDAVYNKPGATTLHEVVESYLAGDISQRTGVNAVPGSQELGVLGNIYPTVHNQAPPQSGGTILETIYDNAGNVVPNYGPTNHETYEVKDSTGVKHTVQTVP